MEVEEKEKEKTGGVVCKRFFCVCASECADARVNKSFWFRGIGLRGGMLHILLKKCKQKTYFTLHIPLTQWVWVGLSQMKSTSIRLGLCCAVLWCEKAEGCEQLSAVAMKRALVSCVCCLSGWCPLGREGFPVPAGDSGWTYFSPSLFLLQR